MLRTTIGWLTMTLVTFAASAAFAEGDATRGKASFDQRKCITCHSVGAEAGPMAQLGGSLDAVGSEHDAAGLTAFLSNPTAENAKAKGHPSLDDADAIADMVAYLSTLTAGADESGE